MNVERGYFYNNGSFLVDERLCHGTLMDMILYYVEVNLLHV